MISLHHDDMMAALKALPDNSIDSCCTDPPYHLTSVVKRFGGANAAPAQFGTDGAFARASTGFMGKQWDGGDIAFRVETWREVYRVLKPGAHLAAFGASRGYHRMACAIEDAGFEIRDSLMYVYGTGFPKSHNLDNKRGDLICGCETESPSECDVRSVSDDDVSPSEHVAKERRQVLQPSMSQSGAPSTVDTGTPHENSSAMEGAAKPFMEGRCLLPGAEGQLRVNEVRPMPAGLNGNGADGRIRDGAPGGYGATLPLPPDADGVRTSHGPQSEKQFACEPGTVAGQSFAQNGGAWPCCGRCGKPMVPEGLGTALKPAFEPIVLARKPLSEGTVAANVLRWRTGALNIDACRVGSETRSYSPKGTTTNASMIRVAEDRIGKPGAEVTVQGRWPANVVHDGSDEVVGAFPRAKGAVSNGRKGVAGLYEGGVGAATQKPGYGDDGSAARFFYSAKASKADRAGSKHPTVKPVSLKEWLVTLITPPGGTVLDPFAGSGTTGAACRNKGFNCILVEREAEYVADIRRRLNLDAPDAPPLVPDDLPPLPPEYALCSPPPPPY